MSIKQDRTGTRTSEDLRRRINVTGIEETIEKVDINLDAVETLSKQVEGLNDTVRNTRESYVSTNAQTFTEFQKERARNNIGAVGEETDPTVPKHVKNITEADISKWNSGTGGGGGVTGDTLPIGSEVDYNGDTVPTGWEEVDNPDEYSTNETFTGKHWIDGKKIYKKVIDIGALPNTGGRYYTHNISNLGRIVEFSAFAYTSDGITIPLPYATPYQLANNISIDIDPTRFYIYAGIDRSNLTGYITMEYTKTTD